MDRQTETRHPEGVAAGRDDPALRARRVQHLRRAAIVLPEHRRPRHRVHADSRAGDGALRRRRRARRGTDRARLGRGARGDDRRRVRRRRARGSGLREAELRQGALGAGRARGFALPVGRRISRARPSPPSWSARPKPTSSGRGSTSRWSSPGARPRSSRRCSPTRSSKSPRPARRCAPTASGSSTRSSNPTPSSSPTPRRMADAWKATKLDNIALLLKAAIEAHGRVGIMLNVRRARARPDPGAAARAPAADDLAAQRSRLGRGQHDHRGTHGPGSDSTPEGGQRPGHRRIPAQQDRHVIR